MTRFILVFSSVLLFSSISYSQFDCRSILNSHLTPIKENSNLLWAAEGIASHGWMNDREITNGMIYLGIDYTKNKSKFYFEGGYKGWRNSLSYPGADNLGDNYTGFGFFQKNRLGLREAFYQYKTDNTTITTGLQTMESSDHFLLNERVVGISAKHDINAFSINIKGGSVLRDFARMGNFCGVRYLYTTAYAPNEILPGNKLGETNFASTLISWDPHFKPSKKVPSTTDEDEFKTVEDDEFKDFEAEDEFKSADDEFSSTGDEFSTVEKEKIQLFSRVGIVIYDEFGSYYKSNKLFYGAFTDITLPLNFTLKLQVINQQITDNNTLAHYTKLGNSITLGKHRTSFNIGYMDKFDNNASSSFIPSFSNLYMGEILRMDTWDIPIVSGEIKHNFPGKLRLYVRLRGIKQLKDNQTEIIDIETGVKLLKHVKLSGILSQFNSNIQDEAIHMARIELRIGF